MATTPSSHKPIRMLLVVGSETIMVEVVWNTAWVVNSREGKQEHRVSFVNRSATHSLACSYDLTPT